MTRRKLISIIIASFWMMLLMGTVYAYSIFRTEVKDYYQLSTLASGLPYMFSLFFYALFMMITGRVLNDKNLRRYVCIGSLSIITGFLLSSITSHFIILVIGYGFFIGSGVGIVYGIPIYIIQRTTSLKKGFLTGLVLFGFGLSPLITAPLGRLLLISFGLHQTFFVFSMIFIMTQLPLSLLFKIRFDDDKYQKSTLSYRSLFNLKFISLYVLFIITSAIGLMMIGLSYQAGATYYEFDIHIVTLSLSVFAICNGFARPIFGYIIDKFGLFKPSLISLSLIGISAIIGILNQGQHFSIFLISYSIFWFNLGAWLSIMPSMIKTYYQKEDYAKVYGAIFTAYGIGAIISTLISGSIIDILGSTSYIYISIMILMMFAFYMLALFHKQINMHNN